MDEGASRVSLYGDCYHAISDRVRFEVVESDEEQGYQSGDDSDVSTSTPALLLPPSHSLFPRMRMIAPSRKPLLMTPRLSLLKPAPMLMMSITSDQDRTRTTTPLLTL